MTAAGGVGRAALRVASVLRTYLVARLRSLQKLPWTIRMFFLFVTLALRRKDGLAAGLKENSFLAKKALR